MRVAALTLVLALAGAAIAVGQSADEQHSDPDDSASAIDIASVRGTHDLRADRLVHTIRTHDAISPESFRSARASAPPGSLCVNIWTRRKPRQAPPDYDACVTLDRDGESLRASVSRHRAGGAVRRVGAAVVRLEAPRRLVVRLDPRLIRRPRAYRWSVQSATFARGCPRARGCEDFAPAAGRTVRTRLGEPRS